MPTRSRPFPAPPVNLLDCAPCDRGVPDLCTGPPGAYPATAGGHRLPLRDPGHPSIVPPLATRHRVGWTIAFAPVQTHAVVAGTRPAARYRDPELPGSHGAQSRRLTGGAGKGRLLVGHVCGVVLSVTWLVSRWRIEGLDRIPASGPVLVVANHISYLDPVFSAVFVHRAKRVPVPGQGQHLEGAGAAGRWPAAARSRLPGLGGTPSTAARRHPGTARRQARADLPGGHHHQDPAGWPMHSRTGWPALRCRRGAGGADVHWGTLDVYDHYKRQEVPPIPRKTSWCAPEPRWTCPRTEPPVERPCCAGGHRLPDDRGARPAGRGPAGAGAGGLLPAGPHRRGPVEGDAAS